MFIFIPLYELLHMRSVMMSHMIESNVCTASATTRIQSILMQYFYRQENKTHLFRDVEHFFSSLQLTDKSFMKQPVGITDNSLNSYFYQLGKIGAQLFKNSVKIATVTLSFVEPLLNLVRKNVAFQSGVRLWVEISLPVAWSLKWKE